MASPGSRKEAALQRGSFAVKDSGSWALPAAVGVTVVVVAVVPCWA